VGFSAKISPAGLILGGTDFGVTVPLQAISLLSSQPYIYTVQKLSTLCSVLL